MNEKQTSNVLFSNNGDQIRSEYSWGVFLSKAQNKFCEAFLDLFMIHLDFIGLASQYEITKAKLNLTMTVPNDYLAAAQQNELDRKWNNYNTTDKDEFAKSWRMKRFLGMTDEEIAENAAALKKDIELGLTPSNDNSY